MAAVTTSLPRRERDPSPARPDLHHPLSSPPPLPPPPPSHHSASTSTSTSTSAAAAAAAAATPSAAAPMLPASSSSSSPSSALPYAPRGSSSSTSNSTSTAKVSSIISTFNTKATTSSSSTTTNSTARLKIKTSTQTQTQTQTQAQAQAQTRTTSSSSSSTPLSSSTSTNSRHPRDVHAAPTHTTTTTTTTTNRPLLSPLGPVARKPVASHAHFSTRDDSVPAHEYESEYSYENSAPGTPGPSSLASSLRGLDLRQGHHHLLHDEDDEDDDEDKDALALAQGQGHPHPLGHGHGHGEGKEKLEPSTQSQAPPYPQQGSSYQGSSYEYQQAQQHHLHPQHARKQRQYHEDEYHQHQQQQQQQFIERQRQQFQHRHRQYDDSSSSSPSNSNSHQHQHLYQHQHQHQHGLQIQPQQTPDARVRVPVNAARVGPPFAAPQRQGPAAGTTVITTSFTHPSSSSNPGSHPGSNSTTSSQDRIGVSHAAAAAAAAAASLPHQKDVPVPVPVPVHDAHADAFHDFDDDFDTERGAEADQLDIQEEEEEEEEIIHHHHPQHDLQANFYLDDAAFTYAYHHLAPRFLPPLPFFQPQDLQGHPPQQDNDDDKDEDEDSDERQEEPRHHQQQQQQQQQHSGLGLANVCDSEIDQGQGASPAYAFDHLVPSSPPQSSLFQPQDLQGQQQQQQDEDEDDDDDEGTVHGNDNDHDNLQQQQQQNTGLCGANVLDLKVGQQGTEALGEPFNAYEHLALPLFRPSLPFHPQDLQGKQDDGDDKHDDLEDEPEHALPSSGSAARATPDQHLLDEASSFTHLDRMPAMAAERIDDAAPELPQLELLRLEGSADRSSRESDDTTASTFLNRNPASLKSSATTSASSLSAIQDGPGCAPEEGDSPGSSIIERDECTPAPGVPQLSYEQDPSEYDPQQQQGQHPSQHGAQAGGRRHLTPSSTHTRKNSLPRPPSAYSALSESQRGHSPGLMPTGSMLREGSLSSSRRSPDVRPSSYAELLNVPYPQQAPAPLNLDNSLLRNAVGNNASLLSAQKTLEMYRQNVKKTTDFSVQYSFAVLLISTAQELGLDFSAADAGHSGGSTSSFSRSRKPLGPRESDSNTPSFSDEAPTSAVGGSNDLLREARGILQKLASAGYPFAQYYLADGFASGILNKGREDYNSAFPLFVLAAKHGHAESAYRTALCYEFGWGCRKDPSKAVQFLRTAASKRHPGAMTRLGKACLSGDLGEKRYREGIKWLKLAAESADAQYNAAPYQLGCLYETGYGDDIFEDRSYAAELFTQAAELGHAEANFRMGDAYEHGDLQCPRDPALSVHFYTGAAELGHAGAMMGLCAWYMVGAAPFLEKDEEEAYEWARRSADLGHVKAQYAIGYFTEMGIGCRRDPLEANVWYVKAADAGDERAKQRILVIQAAVTGQAHANMDTLRPQKLSKAGQQDEKCAVM